MTLETAAAIRQHNDAPGDPAFDEDAFVASVDAALMVATGGRRAIETASRLAVFPGGKRARPRLAFRFAEVARPPRAALVAATAATELIHAASLIHDDILDASLVRRGRPTAHVLVGAPPAILAGDLLLARSLRLLAPYPHELDRAAAAFEEMCVAVTDEWSARRDLRLTAASWRSIAEGKTGALFGLAAYCAASLAGEGEHERAARFDRAARAFGVAFQIADDLADLRRGDAETAGVDLRDGNPSLPVVLAVERDPTLGDALRAYWHDVGDDPAPGAAPPGLIARIVTPRVRAACRVAIGDELGRARRLLGDDLQHAGPAQVLRWAVSLAEVTEVSTELA